DRHRAAVRVADDERALDAERVEEATQRADEEVERVVDAVGLARPAVAERVGDDGAKAGAREFGIVAAKVGPAARAGPRAVQEHDRRAASLGVIVDFQSVADVDVLALGNRALHVVLGLGAKRAGGWWPHSLMWS